MERSTILSGFGGQGILFAGQVLANAGMLEGQHVSWLPSYGPEMRGGTASCTVIVADRPIGSPIVDAAHGVIALNPPSMAKFEPLLVPGGVLVVNASLIEADPARTDITTVALPCTALARTIGDERLVSVIGLGALLSRLPIVGLEAVQSALAQLAGRHRPELVELNLRALAAGLERGGVALQAG